MKRTTDRGDCCYLLSSQVELTALLYSCNWNRPRTLSLWTVSFRFLTKEKKIRYISSKSDEKIDLQSNWVFLFTCEDHVPIASTSQSNMDSLWPIIPIFIFSNIVRYSNLKVAIYADTCSSLSIQCWMNISLQDLSLKIEDNQCCTSAIQCYVYF